VNIRDSILAQNTLPTVPVTVPEWGTGLSVRSMTAAERDSFDASSRDGDTANLANFRARLVVRCLIDPDGKRVFTDADAEAVGKLPAGPVCAVFGAAAKLNGLTKDEVEEIEKN